MRVVTLIAAAAVGLVAVASASLKPDAALLESGNVTHVTSLPGWNASLPLPCEMYSGYVSITDTVPEGTDMKMHYILYGREPSVDQPADYEDDESPIIVWYNGGPGAPSSWGQFIENGPMLTNEQSWTLPTANLTAGIPGLVRNPWAWTKFSTMVAFANPPPSGFSYCDPAGPSGNADACGAWNDTRVGIINAQAVNEVLTKHFPTLLANPNRPVYIIGESYGGVYISETVHFIASNPAYAKVGSHIDGVALGDACMGTEQICGGGRGPQAWLEFFYGRGQFPTDMWDEVHTVCTAHELKWGDLSTACDAYVKKIYAVVGEYYVYNLYDDCATNVFAEPPQGRPAHHPHHPRHGFGAKSVKRPSVGAAPRPTNFDGYWCPGKAFLEYMNLTDVRVALGVPTNSFFFIADDARGMPYTSNLKNGFIYWSALLQNKTASGHPSTLTRPFRLMSYNGDADAAVVETLTEPVWYEFAANNSYTKTEEWRAWIGKAPGIVGGYIVQWDEGRVAYATVRGSGHMVPEYKAQQAYTLFSNFVQGNAPPGM